MKSSGQLLELPRFTGYYRKLRLNRRHLSFLDRMNLRKFAFGAIVAPLFFVACSDTNPFAAQLPTTEDVYTLFALTGTPPAYPSGLNTFARSPTRVDGNANFDVAFDINADGNAVLYPVKLIVTSVSGDRPVGLRKVAGHLRLDNRGADRNLSDRQRGGRV